MTSSTQTSNTPEQRLLSEVKAVLANLDGKVFITTRLSMDCDEATSVECFTASTDGHLSQVEEHVGPEWDFMLIRMASAKKPIAVIERDDVYEAHSQVRNLISSGMTLPQAIVALMG